MLTDLRLPWDGVCGFALVFARVAGAISFVPLPVFKNSPITARIVLALSVTAALLPAWPAVSPQVMEAGLIARWMISEVAFGVTVGVAISFLNEAFVLSSQIFGLQAGYGYASTVDPATQADSSVLQIVSHLASGLLFFAAGLHRAVIRIFADSLTVYPPGQYRMTPIGAEQILSLGTVMFEIAVRMALPVVGLLMLIDVSLALLGRINAQFQLLTLAFPIKMIVSMALLTVIAALMPILYETGATALSGTLRRVLIGG